MKRKIVQIAFETRTMNDGYESEDYTGSTLHALADDGTIWYFMDNEWTLWDLGELPDTDLEEKTK